MKGSNASSSLNALGKADFFRTIFRGVLGTRASDGYGNVFAAGTPEKISLDVIALAAIILGFINLFAIKCGFIPITMNLGSKPFLIYFEFNVFPMKVGCSFVVMMAFVMTSDTTNCGFLAFVCLNVELMTCGILDLPDTEFCFVVRPMNF